MIEKSTWLDEMHRTHFSTMGNDCLDARPDLVSKCTCVLPCRGIPFYESGRAGDGGFERLSLDVPSEKSLYCD